MILEVRWFDGYMETFPDVVDSVNGVGQKVFVL